MKLAFSNNGVWLQQRRPHFRTRHCVTFALAVTAGVFLGFTAEAGLVNGGMEEPFVAVEAAPGSGTKSAIGGEVASGWQDNSAWADVDVHYKRDTETVKAGISSQRIEIGAVREGHVNFIQRISVEKNRAYKCTLWLKGSSFRAAELLVREREEPWKTYFSKKLLISPEWCSFTLSWIASKTGEVLLMLSFPGKTEIPVTIWLDEVEWKDMGTAGTNAPPTEGNLLANSSFEAGLGGGWNVALREFRRLGTAIRSEYADHQAVTDPAVASDGKCSIRVEIPDARAAIITSPWVPYHFNRAHTASIALKASADTEVEMYLEGAPQSNKKVRVGPEWKVYSTSAVLPYGDKTRLVVKCWPEQQTVLWFDAARIEERASASPQYSAPFPVELAFRHTTPGGIFFDGEDARIGLEAAGNMPDGARLQLEVDDLLAGVRPLPGSALPLQEITIKPDPSRPRGIFKLRGQVVSADGKPLSAPVDKIFARVPRPRKLDPEKSFFGTQTPLTPELVSMAQALGFRWLRLHDGTNPTKWRYVEEKQGEFQFCDEGIDAAKAAGFSILGMLDGAPPWASKKPRGLVNYESIYNQPDKPGALDDWSEYVRRTVSHFKDRIHHWEIWNEPWAANFFSGTPEELGEIIKRGYQAAKEVDPGCFIISANSVAHSNASDKWTPAVLKSIGTGFFDALSVHDYNPALYGGKISPPESTAAKFSTMMREVGQPKPIWNTEGGPGESLSWYWADKESLPLVRQQMAHIVRFDVTQMSAGIPHFFYYSFYHPNEFQVKGFGALEQDRSVRPVLVASAVLARLVDGAKCHGRVEMQEGIEAYRFSQNDGSAVTVIWSADGKNHVVKIPEGVRVLDIVGNPVSAEALEVADEPLYLVSAKPAKKSE